ncbi:MAG TPA: MarR family transcriptional regulator [Candidatus Avacidaminococcus intestinavium]|uniref:MarR family transcriptional regulator n=1 Tax=Candidatus Avacidaminococcus intestinavium TaxID=2840684 RepID=A0A9D1MRG6_9FIRM|nr:MarR family transcriptional regulator [Candidatus Avacidaminococcus intestinavium]
MQKELLFKKLHQTFNILLCESKKTRTYGTKQLLSTSEISSLKCIERNSNTKAGDLSRYLGITNGAVTQLAKKLQEKKLIVPYHLKGNNKEVFYELTEKGKLACRGYDEHFKQKITPVEDYIATLDEGVVNSLITIMDLLVQNSDTKNKCAIITDLDSDTHTNQTDLKRCEKCQNSY